MIFPSHPRTSAQVARTQTAPPAQASGRYRSLPPRRPPDQPSAPSRPDPPARPRPGPSPSGLASPFALARSSQPSGARSSRGRIAGVGGDVCPSVRPAERAGWKLRDAAGGAAATHWARPGGGAAPPRSAPRRPRGVGGWGAGGFPADVPEPEPLSWSGSLWPVCAAPGSFRRPAPLSPSSRGFCPAWKTRGERARQRFLCPR